MISSQGLYAVRALTQGVEAGRQRIIKYQEMIQMIQFIIAKHAETILYVINVSSLTTSHTSTLQNKLNSGICKVYNQIYTRMVINVLAQYSKDA
eukprot:403342993